MAETTSIKDKIRVSELTVAELRELIREVVDEVIEEKMKEPNRATRETLEKADRGEELNYYDSLDEFFKKMGV
jgi:histone H3/H4